MNFTVIRLFFALISGVVGYQLGAIAGPTVATSGWWGAGAGLVLAGLLILMEAGDIVSADVKAADAALARARREGDDARKILARERQTLDDELHRLGDRRGIAVRAVDAGLLSKYEQLLKNRRGTAVAAIAGERCTACHVRLRPQVVQIIRRNDEIVQCDSCQRILYSPGPSGSSASADS